MSKSRLTTDPEYNINLGSHYIAGLILQYDGAYPFAMPLIMLVPIELNIGKKLIKILKKNKLIMLIGLS